MLFTVESLFHALLTHFEPLYTNMYLIGPSDSVVLCYMLRLEIYGVTSVQGLLAEHITPKDLEKSSGHDQKTHHHFAG